MDKNSFKKQLSEELANQYALFEKYQSIALDSLRQFDAVCRKNKIVYFLAWGSLLGAVRDNGAIPWDYDADVFIKYEDKERLLSSLENDLSSEYYYETPDNTPKCNHLFIRISKRGYSTDIVHLDIFFLVGTSADDKQQKLHVNKMRKVTMRWVYKNLHIGHAALGDTKVRIKACLRKLSNSIWNTKHILKQYEKLCTQYPLNQSQYCISADREAVNKIFETKYFINAIELKTGEGTFLIPEAYREILSLLYDDYTQYPSSEICISEYEHSVCKFLKYELLYRQQNKI